MSATDQLEMSKLVRAVHGVVIDHVAKLPSVAYGTVTQVSPLEVRVDGSTASQPANRIDTYAPTLDDRVFLHLVRRQAIIHGKIV